MNPRPCTANEAVHRAASMVGKGGQYYLGTGDYSPLPGLDLPWTWRDGELGSDCAGFAICWAYKLRRHRPGFNVGQWSSCSGDINCNSAIEDAQHDGDLFEVIKRPELGALLCYPTFRLPGNPQPFIGHVVIVTGISRCLEWDEAAPDYGLLDTAECCGPNGRKPGVIKSTGSWFTRHALLWPKPQHTTYMLRVKS